jgi:hypothetical protein
MELKTIIFSPEHGSTFKWTGYKERNRNVKNPFYTNPYIHDPYVPPQKVHKSRNGEIKSFRTQTQVNDMMRDLVRPKDQMRSTYMIECDRALTKKVPIFANTKPVIRCPGKNVKTNYHFSNTDDSGTRINHSALSILLAR